ncbi:MAG: hypothetical protein KDD47_21355, partial [Acidobacteria bacterium]|nr:hypothetical protein [Acidobacteriota bacterium]
GIGVGIGIAANISGEAYRGISGEIALGVTFGVVMGKELGVAGAVAFGSAALLGVRRGYYWPIHFAFIFPEARGRWYRFHPVAWDDLCGAPFAGLHRLLVSFAESEPAAAEEEAERLIGTYLTHRSAALKAKTILLVRKAAKEDDLTRIDGLLAELPEGKKGYLKNTQTARDLVGRISVEATRLATADRPFLKEPAARAVVTEIKELRGRVAGFGEPLASELRKAADKWLVVSERQLEEERAALAKAPVGQPFRAGDPVNVEREAFVQRLSVVGELEQQVRLAEGCPGILLHGRRRVGKSTILHNLPHFLPRSFRLARVSLQDPKVFSALPDFCSGLGQAILDAVPETDRETPTNLLSLFDTLQLANQRLTKSKERLILALDEYEGVDVKIGEGVFSEDLLATIRESIQEHRQILWLFAGVHAIEELPHAPWTSYLLSARLIEVPLFSEAETRLLLTEPMKRSPLWRDREEDRPRFEPGFWSEGGIERIQAETGGWPHLVQLVAEAVVDLVNLGSLPAATPQLLEQALDKAVVRGHAVFYELMRRECTTEPEWHYLSGFRSAEVQPLPDDPEVTAALKKRWLVEASGEGLRLRVPLMGRWLRERG